MTFRIGTLAGIGSLLLTVCLFAGCSEKKAPWTCAVKLPLIGAGSGRVDDTHATFGQWGEGMPVAVWSDLPGLGASSGTYDGASSGTYEGGAQYSGWHRAEDGGQIRWSGKTADGKTGIITIEGGTPGGRSNQTFDLAGGALFVATVKDAQLRVKQLKRDVSVLRTESFAETLQDWRENDPDIQAAFAAVIGP